MQEGNEGKTKVICRMNLPLAAFFLGLASLISIFFAVAIAVCLEAVGAVTLFRGFVTPLSIAGIVISLIARSRINDFDQKSQRRVKLGLLFSLLTLALVFFTALILLAFSLPKLFFAFSLQIIIISGFPKTA